ncbi:MAG: alpha-L-fucosidase C-terminal domain-containing protein [Mucilaginibacter sp.]
MFFTQTNGGSTEYAFLLSKTNEVTLEPVIRIATGNDKKVKKVTLLGVTQKLKWKQQGGDIEVMIPGALQNHNGLQYAAAFKIAY